MDLLYTLLLATIAIPIFTLITGLIFGHYQFTFKSIVGNYLGDLISLYFELLYIPIAAAITAFALLKVLIFVFIIGIGITGLIGVVQKITPLQIAGRISWEEIAFYFGIVLIGLLAEITLISYLVKKSQNMGGDIIQYLSETNIKALHKIHQFFLKHESKK